MSGKDERKITIYPPDCPNCLNTDEWYIGYNTWILTERAMKRRGLQFPVLNLNRSGVPQVNGYDVKCSKHERPFCNAAFFPDSDIYKAVIKAFRANYGKLYHRRISGETDNEW